jgi:hypothetical protein
MPAQPQVFDVIFTDEDEKEINIGRVEADPNFKLKIVSAAPEHKEFLAETLDLVNDKNVLHVEAAPPEGAPKFAVYSREVERGKSEFAGEMLSYLSSYYDLNLKPAGK